MSKKYNIRKELKHLCLSSLINKIIMHGNNKNNTLFMQQKIKDINYATKINAVFYVI